MDTAITHYTAWLTTDRSALDGDCMDIEVIQDELLSDDPTDETAWTPTGTSHFHAVTSVDAADGDIDDAIKEAEKLLWDAGWRIVGKWDVTPNAYTVTVARI